MTRPGRARAAAMRWLGHEIWNIGIVDQSVSDIAARGITEPVRWLPPGPSWSFIADPFALPSLEGTWSLFAERMDYWKTKGSIWGGEIAPREVTPWVTLRPQVNAVAHMSFPFAFREAGVSYLLCETWETGGASLYAMKDGGWSFEASVRPLGRNPVDAVLFQHQSLWWLFCSHPDRSPYRELYLYYAEAFSGPWRDHPANPIVCDKSRGRMAGPVFSTESALVRPGQDCSTTYGGGVSLCGIIALDPEQYQEKLIRHIPPIAPYGHGLHTICPIGDRTIIDGKLWRFHPLDPVRKIYSWRTKKARRRILHGYNDGREPRAVAVS